MLGPSWVLTPMAQDAEQPLCKIGRGPVRSLYSLYQISGSLSASAKSGAAMPRVGCSSDIGRTLFMMTVESAERPYRSRPPGKSAVSGLRRVPSVLEDNDGLGPRRICSAGSKRRLRQTVASAIPCMGACPSPARSWPSGRCRRTSRRSGPGARGQPRPLRKPAMSSALASSTNGALVVGSGSSRRSHCSRESRDLLGRRQLLVRGVWIRRQHDARRDRRWTASLGIMFLGSSHTADDGDNHETSHRGGDHQERGTRTRS